MDLENSEKIQSSVLSYCYEGNNFIITACLVSICIKVAFLSIWSFFFYNFDAAIL